MLHVQCQGICHVHVLTVYLTSPLINIAAHRREEGIERKVGGRKGSRGKGRR
jgi:hypothetical protein